MHVKQLRNQIAQFMRIFANMQVTTKLDRDNDGHLDTKPIAVYYGDMDRVVARLVKGEDWSRHSLPAMAVNLEGVEVDTSRMLPHRHHDSTVVHNTASDRKESKTRLMSLPVKMQMGMSCIAANNDQVFQIIESIMLLFHAPMNVNISNEPYNWGHISNIMLTGVQKTSGFPIGGDGRQPAWDFNFTMDAWLQYPLQELNGIIRHIENNIYELSTEEKLYGSNESRRSMALDGGGDSTVSFTKEKSINISLSGNGDILTEQTAEETV